MLVGNLPAIGRPAEPEQIQALLTDVAAAAITANDARRAASSPGGRRWRWVAFPTMCDRGALAVVGPRHPVLQALRLVLAVGLLTLLGRGLTGVLLVLHGPGAHRGHDVIGQHQRWQRCQSGLDVA
jgi:hypothetical protein